jgi:methyltransferase FkbM-like protein
VRARGAMGKLGSPMTVFQSQAGQDRFVHALAVLGEGLTKGTFLDIGCNDPIIRNNTYALEQIGWTGLLVDCEPSWADVMRANRRSPFVCADVETIDWRAVLGQHKMPAAIDYLSFDVDGAGLQALKVMPWADVRFRILTVEHDAYRFGDGVRQDMRAVLRDQGYELLCSDVMNDGLPFEDWWVDPLTVDMTIASRFQTTEAMAWSRIVSR